MPILDVFNVYAILTGAVIGLFFWSRYRSTYRYWQRLNVKYLPPVPILGNIGRFLLQQRSFHDTYDRLYRALADQPYGGIYQLHTPQLLVKDPQLVSAMLVKDFKNFYDRDSSLFSTRNRKLNPLSWHLFFMEGERWRVLRQKLSPVFTSAKLKQMHEQVFECVRLLVAYVDEQMGGADTADVALKELFGRLTIDVIGSCAFGIECNSLRSDDKFGRMGNKVFKPRLAQFVRLVLSMISVRLSNLFRVTDLAAEVNDFFLNLSLDTIEHRRRNGVKRNDLLQCLIDLQNSHVDPKFAVGEDDKKVLTNEEFDEIDIAANSFLFFVAGYETTASTLSYCVYELALNEHIQQKLRDEVQQVKDKHETLGYECLKEMTYMKAVIAETLRKYPPVVALNRRCTEDYVIPGTTTRLPTGTNILIPVWSIQHDWRNYPNPEVFDPERFVGDHKDARLNGTYLPFGDGPRYCLGKRFADMELKAALSEIIMRYDIKPCAKTEIPLKFTKGSFLLQTRCGTWVNITKRKI